jgi:hypothetical protein
LVNGELAINITDGKLYYKDNAGVVRLIASTAALTSVDSISFGTTGLTPATATTGVVTVAGTLNVANGGTGQTTYTNGQLLIGNTTGNTLTKSTLTAGTGISIANSTGSITITAINNGTVTAVTGTSPVVSSGGATPDISLASGYGDTQNPYASKTANNFLAAPNGVAGAPTFRAVVAADIPTLNQNTTGSAATLTTGRTIAITGDLAYTSPSFDGSTNVTATGTLATVNSNVGSFTNANVTVNAKGLVTAVSSNTAPVTSVTGTSPVVSSGGATPAISLASGYGDTQNPYASKTANFILAAPNGTAGAPTFRAVVAADIPTLNQNTTGTAAGLSATLVATSGGTGQSTYAVGDLLVGGATNTLNKLADIATGNALISGGVGVAPSYGKIGLTTHVSGNLPVTNLNSGSGASASTFWRGDGTWASGAAAAAATPSVRGTVFGSMDTTGGNAAVGYLAFADATTATDTTMFGAFAGRSITTGTFNVGFGNKVLFSLTTGVGNAVFGNDCIDTPTAVSNNAAFGNQALRSCLSDDNAAFGTAALTALTTGTQNTAIGRSAGSTLTTGSNNILIGRNSAPSAITVSNEITIGNSSNTVVRYPHSYSTVASLPSAATVGRGSRTFVTDALTPTFQATVAGGGAVFTPVYSDGTNWKVG